MVCVGKQPNERVREGKRSLIRNSVIKTSIAKQAEAARSLLSFLLSFFSAESLQSVGRALNANVDPSYRKKFFLLPDTRSDLMDKKEKRSDDISEEREGTFFRSCFSIVSSSQ